MANLSRFILNSDYTAEKQDPGTYEATLSIPQLTVAPNSSRTYYTDISVPKGTYLEVGAIKSTLTNQWAAGLMSEITYNDSSYNSAHTFCVFYRLNATTQRLQVQVYAYNNSGNVTLPAQTITARVHLSVSPF